VTSAAVDSATATATSSNDTNSSNNTHNRNSTHNSGELTVNEAPVHNLHLPQKPLILSGKPTQKKPQKTYFTLNPSFVSRSTNNEIFYYG